MVGNLAVICHFILSLLVRLPADAASGQMMRMAMLVAMALALAGLSLWTLGSRGAVYLAAINWSRFDLVTKFGHADDLLLCLMGFGLLDMAKLDQEQNGNSHV